MIFHHVSDPRSIDAFFAGCSCIGRYQRTALPTCCLPLMGAIVGRAPTVAHGNAMDEELLTRNYFLVHFFGQVESCVFPGEDFDFLYCKCLFRNGPDWAPVPAEVAKESNKQEAVFISQTAIKSDDAQQMFVWNLPLEATFRSTNVFGWPQFVVSVYGADSFGRDVVRGYGWCHLPPKPGQHCIRIPLFTPQSTSILNHITSWFGQSRMPEFVDSRLVAGSEGRSLVTVQNGGEVLLQLNVLFKDFKKFGFVSR